MTAPIDEARLRELAEADHAVISRCVERQPKLYMRGQHEGYYIHSDVADLIDIIGRMSDALSAERERVADMQRRLDLWEPKPTSGSSIAVSSRIGGNNAPLATQKAEGTP